MEAHTNPKGDAFPARIRMLTFTRAAAAEFAETMEREGLGEGIQAPSTIHAFALGILRKSEWTGVPQPVRIAGSWEVAQLIRPQLSRLLRALDHPEATPGVVGKLEAEMAAGFESLDPDRVLLGAMRPQLRNAYQGLWRQHRERLGYLLLSELPFRAADAVEDLGMPDLDLDILLVDEYQDLNRADIHLIELVARAGIAVVAIGDEDQSIYRWRHAAPQGIRDFPADFGVDEGDDYRLTVSRRCGAAILRAAQTLIEQAPDRPRQAGMTPYDPDKLGEIAYLRFGGMGAEAAGIAAIVAARLRAGVPARKIAILARTRIDEWVTALRPTFDARGILIASATWVEDALRDDALIRLRASAHLSVDLDDSLAWMTLIELEPFLGNVLLDALYRVVAPGETFAGTVRRVSNEGLAGLRQQGYAGLHALVERTMHELEAFAVEEGAAIDDWGQWLLERATAELSDDAQRLLLLVGPAASSERSLAGFLGQLEPIGRDLALAEQDAVRFMTMGSSKGLTVDTAVVVGVENGYVPLPRGDADEERRLLYVAMTRATDFCVLTFSGRRSGPLARSGRTNLNRRTRSPLLEGVLDPQNASEWIGERGW